jgi:hypothetical protein
MYSATAISTSLMPVQGPLVADQLGLEQAVERLGQGVVVRVALGADRSHGGLNFETFGVAQSSVLGEFNQSLQQPGVATTG